MRTFNLTFNKREKHTGIKRVVHATLVIKDGSDFDTGDIVWHLEQAMHLTEPEHGWRCHLFDEDTKGQS